MLFICMVLHTPKDVCAVRLRSKHAEKKGAHLKMWPQFIFTTCTFVSFASDSKYLSQSAVLHALYPAFPCTCEILEQKVKLWVEIDLYRLTGSVGAFS